MLKVLIKSPDGLTSELHTLSLEETFSYEKDGRSGCVFRTITGKAFFLPFERFSFYIPQ